MSMYGSIHTHFESQYDTGNEKEAMVKRFISTGAKKVAVTEHGVFSSYEDLKDIVEHVKEDAAKEKKENPNVEIPDFDIIPGVEGYFEDNAAHLILVAKDYEGYLSLCKIISESNKNMKKSKPIITLDNLKQNVNKGHLICTTACIAGPFGQILGLDAINLKEKVVALESDLVASGYRELAAFAENYEQKKRDLKDTTPTKKEIADAQRIAKKTGNETLLEQIAEREAKVEDLSLWLEENSEAYKTAVAQIKRMGKAVQARKVVNLEKYKEELRQYEERVATGEIEMEAHLLLEDFLDIFGEKDFYFEIQNHGLSQEDELYNKVISFAYRAGHPNFIASNDIHVGVRKTDPNYEDMLLRRNVIKYTRFNKYEEESADDREYVIKTDEELREELLKIVKPVNSYAGEVSAEEIVDNAIGNIKGALESCNIEFPKNQNHYPKFCDNENEEFERQVRAGIAVKFPNGFPNKEYEERLEYELDVIKKMGYAGYHLIVADYLTYGRLLGYLPTAEEIENAPNSIEELDAYIEKRGYPRVGYNIGPGRGSAAGSLCCYLMGITDIDPIPYGLLFERFLNVERVSMPDIDSDFRTDIRGRVVEYCRAKYGAECLCQIMTKSFGATKGNLRLAARYLGSIECEKNEKYKALEEELDEIKATLNYNPEIAEKKDALTDAIAATKKLLKAEEDEKRTAELEEQIISLEEELQEASGEEAQNKVLLNARKEAIITEMNGYMKTWYARADELAKLYDELGGNLPDVSNLTEEKAQIVELAEKLDGVFTGYGEHAAGTIISGDDITDVIPLKWNKKKGAMETQCTMAQAEAKGLLKMDFLGLRNLDIITNIVRNPTKTKKLEAFLNKTNPNRKHRFLDDTLQDYTRRDEMLKDPAIYKDIFCTGLTQGVFQFESDGMKNMLVEFQPESFEDIILLVAAYRPGPIDYIPEIIASKWHEKDPAKYPAPKKSISLKNDALEAILSPTYGCPIYQEQIMQIFQQMAGYSLGGADVVRRYMSKKKVDKLAKEKQAFIFGDEERGIPGCMKLHGLTEKQADDLFEQMMPFAKYGFNKSHATAYAMVALFTAYLKKYHTEDFFRYSLNAIKELKEIPAFVSEMSAFNLELVRPTLGSQNDFTVESTLDGTKIRYGLKYVKGFSEQNIRKTTTLYDFILQNPGLSLKTVEKYAQLGVFEECWPEDKKTGRVHGNRHACLDWLKENGKLVQTLFDQIEKTEELKIVKDELEQKLSASVSEEEQAVIRKELNKVSNQYTKWMKKRQETSELRKQHEDLDKIAGRVEDETPEQILKDRKWEIEFLSMPFTIDDSLRAVRASANKNTFDVLKKTKEENEGRQSARVSAVVLSVSEAKKTKSGTSTYYEVSLMDRNKSIITRRFKEKPDMLEGDFLLMLDECKFYTSESKYTKALLNPKKNKKSFILNDSSPEEKLRAFKMGGKMEFIQTAGGFTTPVIVAPSEEKDDEYDDR